MGLRSEFKKYKREKELRESELISSLINRIEVLEKRLSALEQNRPTIPALTDDEKKKLKILQDSQTKPADFIGLFTGDIEEFNPNA